MNSSRGKGGSYASGEGSAGPLVTFCGRVLKKGPIYGDCGSCWEQNKGGGGYCFYVSLFSVGLFTYCLVHSSPASLVIVNRYIPFFSLPLVCVQLGCCTPMPPTCLISPAPLSPRRLTKERFTEHAILSTGRVQEQYKGWGGDQTWDFEGYCICLFSGVLFWFSFLGLS